MATRRAVLALTGALAIFPLAGTAQPSLTKLRVVTVTGDEVTPPVYAMRAGLYRRAGLDVELLLGTSGAAIVAALISGSYDIGKSSLPSLIGAHLRGLPIVLVAAGGVYDSKEPYEELCVAADSPLRTAKDLNGKTVAVPALNDLNHLSILAWSDQNGGDSKTLKVVELSAAACGAALASHRIDAALISNLALGEALRSGQVRIVAPAKNALAPKFLNTAWASTPAWATEHADVVRAFARATAEAAQYTNAHHAETEAMVAEVTKIPPDVVHTMPRAVGGTALNVAEIQPLINASAKYAFISRAFPAKEMMFDDGTAR